MTEKPSFDNDPGNPRQPESKPAFDEKPSFEPQENLFEIGEEEKRGLKLPSRKTLLVAGGALVAIVVIAILAMMLLGGESDQTAKPKTSQSTTEIEGTVKRFYDLLANPSDDVCNFFAEGVFDPEKPLEACRQWREENFSSIPKIQDPIEIEQSGDTASVLYKLQAENTPAEEATEVTPSEPGAAVEPGAPAEPGAVPPAKIEPGATTESGAETVPYAEPVSKDIPEITPRSASRGEELLLQGGVVLEKNGPEWQLATLAGLPGSTANESELQGELGEEYDLFQEGTPLYELPSEEPSAPLPEEPAAPQPLQPEDQKTRFSCPGAKRLDLVADIRSEDFRLFKEQRAVAGGDIREASHSSGAKQSCLSIKFEDNYASVENLVIRLSHNSWQGTAAASFILSLGGGVPVATIASTGGKQRETPIQFEESDNKEQILVKFPTPPEWKARSAPRQFWFLRSSFQDPLGSGEELFDEGRPAGQIAPASAKNLEGGWPF